MDVDGATQHNDGNNDDEDEDNAALGYPHGARGDDEDEDEDDEMNYDDEEQDEDGDSYDYDEYDGYSNPSDESGYSDFDGPMYSISHLDNSHRDEDEPYLVTKRRLELWRKRHFRSCDRYHPTVPMVKPRGMPYKGHVNVATVKDVNFYGLRDEYIVSGSDTGLLIIWDKAKRNRVVCLLNDSDVTNVIEPNPVTNMIAASGIENSVKIYQPIEAPRGLTHHHPLLHDPRSFARRQYRRDDVFYDSLHHGPPPSRRTDTANVDFRDDQVDLDDLYGDVYGHLYNDDTYDEEEVYGHPWAYTHHDDDWGDSDPSADDDDDGEYGGDDDDY